MQNLGILRSVRSEYVKKIRKDYESGKIRISRHSFLQKEIREDGVCNTLDSVQKDNLLAVDVGLECIGGIYGSVSKAYQRGVYEGGARCLKSSTHDDCAVFEVKPEVIGGIGEKNFGKQWRQGNRVYDSDKIATALESQPVGNVGGNTNLYAVKEDSSIDEEDSKNKGIFVQISEELTVYAVWYPKKQCYIAIRKLTPKECFRLQGWTDDYFEKAQAVSSDSQLYKQAGNGVTVNVIRAIAERMK